MAVERLLVDLDPSLQALLAAIRAVADKLGYDEPIVAATHARRYADEVPSAEQRGKTIILAFLDSAAATVRDGALVSAPTQPGGARQLVFHRTVPVRHKLKVMEAVVIVDAGTAHIARYGTPKSCVMSIFSFPTARESMNDALVELREVSELDTIGSEEQDGLRCSLFAEAMASLVGAYCGMTGDEASRFPSPDDHATVSSLVADSRSLGGYVYGALNYAIRCQTDGWYEPCLRRSAIQFLLDEHPAVLEVIDREDIDEMDEALRERALEVEPVPERALPTGLPDNHWWWRLPAAR
ncbi:hypothetical protein [Nocardia sp. NPDC051981]|uniref:hypothetical protein n=1 Tax=Nocardia sp. NPDC051981 TaxID=3155417 RepID=UPI00342D7217